MAHDEVFEEQRPRLRAVALRVLGSSADADDVVQDAWLRLERTDPATIENLPGWLTTVVSRLCQDRLRTRRPTAAPTLDAADPEPGPEATLEQADQVEAALQVVLGTLSPAERLAFVLHDLFGLAFEEVGQVMGRSEAAVRQLASRGRRRVRGGGDPAQEARVERRAQRQVVDAFLAAARGGDLRGLIEVLDPEAVVRADAAAVRMGTVPVLRGAEAVAAQFSGGAKVARRAVIDGWAGLVWAMAGQPRVAFAFTLVDGRVGEIELIADEDVLAALDWEFVLADSARERQRGGRGEQHDGGGDQ